MLVVSKMILPVVVGLTLYPVDMVNCESPVAKYRNVKENLSSGEAQERLIFDLNIRGPTHDRSS